MIDPKLLRSDLPGVAAQLARRGFTLDTAAFAAIEERRKAAQIEADRLRAERNANAKAVGMAKGKGQDASALIAAGEADLYPRLGRTMEWDIAASHAVLRAAGGEVTRLDGTPLAYGKPGFENPHFVARGL